MCLRENNINHSNNPFFFKNEAATAECYHTKNEICVTFYVMMTHSKASNILKI